MDPAPDVLDGAGRLAVNDVERALGVEPNELGVRLAQPDRVVLMPRGVDEDVPDSIDELLPLAVGVPRGDDLDLVTRQHERSCQVAGVVLHAADAVLRDDERDDADPQFVDSQSGSVIRRAGQRLG